MRMLITAVFAVALFQSPPAVALTECEFIKATMNKLGSRMAILRHAIASNPDSLVVDKASAELSEYSKNYRLAKRQYNKAHCGDRWDRD